MRLRSPTPVWICAVFALAGVSTSRGSAPATDEGVAYFETHIRPLLAGRCYACHSERAGVSRGGLTLDRSEGWSAGGVSGPTVIPGDVDASLLIEAVRYTAPGLRMPPDGPLPPDEIERLERWVRMGAPAPRQGEATGTTPRDDPSDPIAGRDHWAFRPLAEPRPPAVGMADWPRSAIDSFVLARLESAGLEPAPDADRRTLARRVYFQLIGLPPTPRQVAAFLDDERPDALERLVDELLDSPRFGERWGRHWLDLARYADSNGLDENFLFREAWRYRNWVIDAVNADMPFDRFALEQIAGDLLPYDSIEQRDRQRIASGFLVIGPKVLLGVDPEEQRMDVADEQLDTIGRAFLGQTIGCARCHDHKFDPIPTADYYALAGILTSTDVMERRHMLGEQRVMERLVGLGPDGDDSDAAYERYWRDRPGMVERRTHARSALELLQEGNAGALEAFAGEHADAFAEGAIDPDRPIEGRIEAQEALLAQLDAALDSPPEIPPRAMIPGDRREPADEHIRLAGRSDRPGESVPRGFPLAISDAVAAIPEGQSGRLELGRWLTDRERGAGRLTARVLANRVWHHLIGSGIVRTADNFGRTGEAPSHPELLDHLAGRLIDSGWSIKSLVRQIILSRTFAMSSDYGEAGHAIDPENRLLWRAHRRRLGPEALRDAMLSVAGGLDPTPMDSTVWYLGDQATAVGSNTNRRRTDFPCRSVYLPVIRNDLPEVFDAFNFADPHATTGMRPRTMVATQGLFLLNDDSVMDAAEATARRLLADEAAGGPEALVASLFDLVLNAQATEEDRDAVLAFVHEMETRPIAAGGPVSRLRAWTMACHALFASSRFQMLE